jgi:hypothetical protein
MMDPYTLNADEAIRALRRVDDPGELDRLHDRERAHPRYEGGRSSVLDAIEERRGELALRAPESTGVPPSRDPRWRVGRWGGHANYECERCAFATLDEERMQEHQRARHPQARPPEEPEGADNASDDAAADELTAADFAAASTSDTGDEQ